MTKARFLTLLSMVILVIGIFLFRQRESSPPVESPQGPSSQTPDQKAQHIDVEKLQIDGKRVMGLPPGREKAEIVKIRVSNTATEDWKPALEKALLAQGGDKIKDIKMEKVDSFIWTESDVALHVESVKVTLKNERDHSVSFNVLVDSETGKILKNWNQPVIDHFNQKDHMKIRIDPRYHQ